MKKNDIELEILKLTVKELKPLLNEVVFLGGSIISLFVDEPSILEIRETLDVDCAIEISHREDYEKFAKKLRKIGFSEDITSKVICRFKKGELLIDIMPTDEKILGFSNRWYKKAFKFAIEKKVNMNVIKVFDLPYLIATKIEAFKGRGKGQFMLSHDIEDIVTLIDGCSSFHKIFQSTEADVRTFVKNEFSQFIKDSNFTDAIDAHISDRVNVAGRKRIVLEKMRALVES